MKKLILTLGLILIMATAAGAAQRQFSSLTVDVPEGWTVQEQGPMVLVIAPGQKAVAGLVVGPAKGMSSRELAETSAKAVKSSEVRDEGDGYYSVAYENNGQKGVMLIRAVNDKAVVCTLMGEHPQLMDVARSVQPR